MESQSENPKPVSSELRLDQEAACDSCGQFGAFQLADRALCPECYQQSGACCAGCGPDDPDDCP